MFEISVVMDFSSAHNLRGYRGKCEALHGHNWKVKVSLGSKTLDNLGMVEDFTAIKERLKTIVVLLDHRYLNDLPFFKKANPTSENIAKFIYGRMKRAIPSSLRLICVSVWETENSSASYHEP